MHRRPPQPLEAIVVVGPPDPYQECIHRQQATHPLLGCLKVGLRWRRRARVAWIKSRTQASARTGPPVRLTRSLFRRFPRRWRERSTTARLPRRNIPVAKIRGGRPLRLIVRGSPVLTLAPELEITPGSAGTPLGLGSRGSWSHRRPRQVAGVRSVRLQERCRERRGRRMCRQLLQEMTQTTD